MKESQLLFDRIRKYAVALAVAAFVPSAFAQSEFQGTYVGYAYIRLEGAVTQPETATGTVIAEVDASGGITLLDGTTGTVDAGGTITWTEPNDLFLTAGNITDGTLNGSGSTAGTGVTTFTRIELNAGGGFDAADSLDEVFELINPENLLQNGVRVIHDGTRFVTMSENGTVSVSTDGLTWTSRSIGSVHPIEDFAYGGGTYIAVGEQNTILTSTDLETWVPRSSGIGDIQNWTLHTVDFFNGRFYIGNTIGTVARSADATAATWEAPVIPGDALSGLGATIKIREVNGVLIVAGKPLFNPSRVVKYSTDGVTFTDSTISQAFASTAAQIFPATMEGTDYIIINFGTHISVSANGASFNAFANPQNFGFMTFDGSRFIARTLGSNAQFYHSTNLSTWTLDTGTAFAGVDDAARSGSTMVAVGTTGRVAPSTTDWQAVTTSAINRLPGGNNLQVVYGNGRHIVFDSGDGFLTTDNGETWQTVDGRSQIVFGNGVFLSGSEVSLDGENWTPVSILTDELDAVRDIGFDGSEFLVTSNMDRAYTSADGFTWQQVSTDAPGNIATLVGHQGEWLALRTGGAYDRSLDGGATWTSHVISNATLNDAAYGNGRWMMVAQNGRIRSSASAGGTFPEVGPVLTQGGALTSVKFIDGRFVVYRDNFSTYFVSETGLSGSWEEKTYAHAHRMNAAAAGPDATLVTGFNNIVLRIGTPSVGHPLVTADPVESLTLDQDGTLNLSAAAIGDGPLSYQWYRGNRPLQNLGRVTGADTPNLQITDLRGSDAGIYQLRIFNAKGSVVTRGAEVEVRLKSQIVSPPQSVTVLPGTNATFTVEASPDTTGIQWLFNGGIIPGANSPTLLVENVSAANAGLYEAVLTNEVGDTTTPPASLSILAFAEGYLFDNTFAGNLPDFSGVFSSSSGMSVSRILPLPDGKIIVAGQFAYHNGTQETYSLVRLNADGSLDPAFVMPRLTFPVAGNPRPVAIMDAAVDSQGRVTVVFVGPATVADGVPVQELGTGFPASLRVARFAPDGSIDLPHAAGAVNENVIRAVAIDSQDRIIFGGTNLHGSSSTRKHVVRLLANGEHDTGFASFHNQISVTQINALGVAVNADDTVLVVGQNVGTSTQFVVRKLAVTGGLSPGFTTPLFTAPIFANGLPRTSVPLADGGLVVIGPFANAGGSPAAGIARFAANGTRVTELDTQGVFTDFFHRAVLPLPGGTMFVGGTHQLAGIEPPAHNLTELDENWQPVLHTGLRVLTSQASAPVESLARSADGGSIFAGHNFGTATGLEHALVSRIGISSGPIPGAPALAIVSQTPDTFAEPGDPVTLTVAAVGANVSFQWLKNGQEIEEATSSSLTFPSVSPGDAAQYRVRITDVSGSITGLPITLTVPGTVEQANFDNWPPLLDLPEEQRAPDATPAGDGVPNLVKYAIGIGPLESAAGRIPQEVLESTADDETYPTVCFVRDTKAVGVTLQVEAASGLDFATDLGTSVVSTEDLGDGLERVCVRSNARFADQTRQFFRLRVSES